MLEDGDLDAVENSEPIMTLRVRLRGDDWLYAFEFYRLDDRRVGVRLQKEWPDGTAVSGEAVTDFYITTFALKKVANAFLALSKGETFDPDSFGYGD